MTPSLALGAAATPPRTSWSRLLMWAVLLAVLAGSWKGADMRPLDLFNDAGNMAAYVRGFLPPNFTDWRNYLSELVVTLQIAVWGTALAIVCSVPLALLAAGNITPWWIHQPARRVLDAFRSINEMVFALLFVVAVGLGPFAGVLALWVHTTGTLAKLCSEAVEAIDPQPVEGIRATGAHPLEEIIYGVLPQVMPLWISFALYRFESNVRSASVVGMVGAGGIGMVLWEVIRGFQYAETAAVLLMLDGHRLARSTWPRPSCASGSCDGRGRAHRAAVRARTAASCTTARSEAGHRAAARAAVRPARRVGARTVHAGRGRAAARHRPLLRAVARRLWTTGTSTAQFVPVGWFPPAVVEPVRLHVEAKRCPRDVRRGVCRGAVAGLGPFARAAGRSDVPGGGRGVPAAAVRGAMRCSCGAGTTRRGARQAGAVAGLLPRGARTRCAFPAERARRDAGCVRRSPTRRCGRCRRPISTANGHASGSPSIPPTQSPMQIASSSAPHKQLPDAPVGLAAWWEPASDFATPVAFENRLRRSWRPRGARPARWPWW